MADEQGLDCVKVSYFFPLKTGRPLDIYLVVFEELSPEYGLQNLPLRLAPDVYV